MKPPVVHQPVQPPRPHPDDAPEDAPEDAKDDVPSSDTLAADDGRNVRDESTEGPLPGLVGDFGPIVATSNPAIDGAADDEREID